MGIRYVPGEWNTVCDVCGFEYKATELKDRWDGAKVCARDWEPRHVLDFFKVQPDNTGVPWSRPEYSYALTVYTTNKVLAASETPQHYFDTTASGLLCMLPAANEGVRTNYSLQSASLDVPGVGTGWVPSTLTVTPNLLTAPDGTLSVDFIKPDVSLSQHRIVNSTAVIPTTGVVVTGSICAALDGVTYPYIVVQISDIFQSKGAVCYYNLLTGALVSTASLGTGTFISASARPIAPASGYSLSNAYLITVTGIITPPDTALALTVAPVNNTTLAAYNGDGVHGMYLWNGQLEVGSTPSGPLLTTTASVTRASADTFHAGTTHQYNIVNYAGANNVFVSSPSGITGSQVVTPGTTGSFQQDFTSNLWRRL